MTGRKPLHFGIFLGAGGIISAISGYILLFTEAENKSSMKLFLWIGIIFLIIGIIKFIIKIISEASEKESEIEKRLAGIDEIDKAEKKIQKGERPVREQTNNKRIIYCPRCGTPNYEISNYCHICGTRLK